MTIVQTLLSFEGRIRRSTWWAYVILTVICSSFIAWIVGGLLVGGLGDGLVDRVEDKVGWLVMIWPLMALNVKRGHDLGWSGWWTLLSFVPIVNLVYWAILGFQDQQPGAERYGLSPKAGLGAPTAPV